MSWRVLYVTSRSEKKVNQRLTELGLLSYLPLKTEKKQWSDRIKKVTTPLINGYVFVDVTEKNRDEVFKAQGVLNYVRYNGGDAIVRNIEIDALKSIEQKGYYVEGGFGTEISKGNSVIIKYGPFKGLRGIVESTTNEEIYSVLIESIGYALTIKVPKEVLEKNENILRQGNK